MRMTKCDRCGFIYCSDPLEPENDLHIETASMFGLQKDSIDLCPMCAMDFKKFMSRNPGESDFRDLIEYDKRRTDGQTS